MAPIVDAIWPLALLALFFIALGLIARQRMQPRRKKGEGDDE